MPTPKRRRKTARARRLDRLIRLCGGDQFPATLVVTQGGQVVARLISEADYQEVTSLAATPLRHLADEAERSAIPLEEVRGWLRQRREARRDARGDGE